MASITDKKITDTQTLKGIAREIRINIYYKVSNAKVN